jgi:sugar lactone lactonase YvrE
MKDVVVSSFVEPGAGGLAAPAGLALSAAGFVVADHATGHLRLYDRTSGLPLGSFDTQRGPFALGGLAVDSDGNVWFTDMVRNEVVRVLAQEWTP